MGPHTVSVLCLVLLVAQIAFGEVWEFGKANTPGSIRIFHKDGHMGLFEHNKKIHLLVPPCYVLTYVKVEVRNMISNPEVQFNSKTNIVNIVYSMFSSSLSSFDIIGKAVWIPGCTTPPNRHLG